MPLRFRRSMKLAPGFRLNFGTRGMSVSLGGRGSSVTFGRRGVYASAAIPGTGLSFRERIGGGSHRRPAPVRRTTVETSMSVTLRMDDDGVLRFLDGAGRPLPPKLVKITREQHGDKLDQILQDECDLRNQEIRALLDIHVGTPAPGLYRQYAPVPFAEPEPAPPAPRRPGLLARFLKSRREAFVLDVARERQAWEAEHEAWVRAREQHQQRERAAQERFALAQNGDVEAMNAIFDELLRSLEWPRETSVSFQFSDDGRGLLLDIDLPEIEDMPQEEVTVAGRGLKLNVKRRPEAQRRREYARHIHGVVFRMIGEAFSLLPSVREVVCSGYSQRTDRATGRVEDDYLVSVRAAREAWAASIAFDRLEHLDPVEALGRYEIVRELRRDGKLGTIEPFGTL